MTTGGNVSRDTIQYLPIGALQPNPHQPRKRFDQQELEELAASIRQYGIQQPLTVARNDDGSLTLIAGERRLRAAGVQVTRLVLQSGHHPAT